MWVFYELRQGDPQSPYSGKSLAELKRIQNSSGYESILLSEIRLAQKQTYTLASEEKETTYSFDTAVFVENYREQSKDCWQSSSNTCESNRCGSWISGYPDFREYELNDYTVQSEETDTLEKHKESAADSTQQVTVGFEDELAGQSMDLKHSIGYTQDDYSANSDIQKFLSRPVKIYTINWGVGNTLDSGSHTIQPWHLFFNNAAIKRKLDNYYMLRCNLKVKIVINASPFYYSGAIASYQPLTNMNPAPIRLSAANLLELIPFSQRPHIYFYPQANEGGTMSLPFLYHKEWLNATSAIDLQNMGAIAFQSFTALANANSVAGTDCTIQVYAWAEDVELAGPTLELAVQSKEVSKKTKKPQAPKGEDEYSHEGTVSKPASALARAMGMLSDVPVIGPYASATSYALDKAAGVASLFGYTDVPVIDDVHEFKNQPFPQLASADIGIPIEKATLDAKNELSIDPSICGVESEDELLISKFVGRESYIAQTTWTAAQAEDTLLYNFNVTPGMVSEESTGGLTKAVYFTPMGFVSRAFHEWRGDIIFRFKFLCSQYHRGRVKISWDPIGDIANTAETTSTVYTKIVDLASCSDVSFRVPYTQTTAYKTTPSTTAVPLHGSSPLTSGQGYANGILTVRVLTQQTSPVSSADITLLMFVKGAENLEFANPDSIKNHFSPYMVQSQEVAYDEGKTEIYNLGVEKSTPDPSINHIYMGESIMSLRTLMRRSNFHAYYPFNRTYSATNTIVRYLTSVRRLPALPGYDTNGPFTANELIGIGTHAYNYVHWTYLSWFLQCFVGNRGSVNWQCNAHSTFPMSSVHMERISGHHELPLATSRYMGSAVTTSTTLSGQAYFMQANVPPGLSGATMTGQRTQIAVSLSVPLYSRLKFVSNNINTRLVGETDEDTTHDGLTINSIVHPIDDGDNTSGAIELWCSAGADFNPVFFLNCPVIYDYFTIPTDA